MPTCLRPCELVRSAQVIDGGLDLGLMDVVGGEIVWHAENDDAPARVLARRFPGVVNHGDITTTDWSSVTPVDWLTAGYPCQPFSQAGKRKGSADARHLWPDVATAIGVLRPGHVLIENVAGHVSLGLEQVTWDLAALGYDATWGVVRASNAGAPHQRARVFIIAIDTDAAADAGGQAQGLGSGLRTGEPRGFGWRRPDHDAAQAAAHAIGGGEPDRGTPGWASGQRAPERAQSGHAGDAAAHAERIGRQSGWDDAGQPQVAQPVDQGAPDGDTEWGVYAAAIHRWGNIIGRPAPEPTDLNGKGGRRLSPRFVEWMMGLPAGWVTDAGLARNQQLKALGNGVVPQQCALALRILLPLATVAA